MSSPEKQYSPFQLFTLLYLAAEEVKRSEREREMDSLSYVHHSHSSVPPYPVKTNIDELSSITPHSVIPCKIEEIKTLSYQLHELANQGLLEWDRRNQGTDLEGFSITSTGKFIIRKNFAELISELMKNKSLGEVIEKEKEEEIGSQTRSFLGSKAKKTNYCYNH
jgi:hypothetical protein